MGETKTTAACMYTTGPRMVRSVRENDTVPEGNGRFDYFLSYLQLNAGGQIAFEGVLKNNSGGVNDDVGIYESDGVEIVKVAREGDTLAGGVVTFFQIRLAAMRAIWACGRASTTSAKWRFAHTEPTRPRHLSFHARPTLASNDERRVGHGRELDAQPEAWHAA